MREVIEHPEEVPTWQAAARGQAVDWVRFMSPWAAAVDFPSALYYRELMAAFPDAKVILSVRDPDSWYESMRQTIVPALTSFPNRLIMPLLPRVSGPGRVMDETRLRRDLLDRFDDREHAKKIFVEWNEEVRRTVPAERLLVFEPRDGWKLLCDFLGVPAPDEPFPRLNDTAEFQRFVRAATVMSWALLLVPVALAVALAAWML